VEDERVEDERVEDERVEDKQDNKAIEDGNSNDDKSSVGKEEQNE
jgi:hypothetical protein